jgi:hypothetical protein
MKDHLKAFGAWVLARMQEKSTYAGFAMVATAIVGHHIPDQYVDAASWAGQFIGAGLVAATESELHA